MTWEELFEARMFSSYVIKSTLDNPMNKTYQDLIKDPILRLLEGDNIKDKIFNYEQNLWSLLKSFSKNHYLTVPALSGTFFLFQQLIFKF